MGQVIYGTDLWPTWPTHICRPADSLSALLLLFWSYVKFREGVGEVYDVLNLWYKLTFDGESLRRLGG